MSKSPPDNPNPSIPVVVIAPRPHRRRSWSLWLAFRALITGLVALVAATVVQSAALPKLTAETKGLPRSALVQLAAAAQPVLPYVPAPAILLAVAALVLRPFRPLLAPLAALFALLALVIVAGSLILALAPLYQLPAELQP